MGRSFKPSAEAGQVACVARSVGRNIGRMIVCRDIVGDGSEACVVTASMKPIKTAIAEPTRPMFRNRPARVMKLDVVKFPVCCMAARSPAA